MRAAQYQQAFQNRSKSTSTLPLVVALLIAFVAGASFVLALAPYGVWGIALVSPMILYALLLNAGGARAFWLGQVYGFGLWLTGAFWLYTSIHEYGAVPAYLALVMIALMALVMGLFHGLMSWVFVRFFARQPLAFASLWVVQEWLKTWLLTGFPWLFVGYAFTELESFAVLAPVVGVLGIGFVAVLLSVAVVEVARRRWLQGLLALIPMFMALGLMLAKPTWTTATGKALSVSLVQGNIPQDLKWLSEYQQETLNIYADLSLDEWGQDLLILPEGAIPVFQDDAWFFLQDVAAIAKLYDTTFITGIPYKDLEAYDETQYDYPPFYNSVMALGASTGLYKKQNLVPFGEYIPMRGLMNILPNLANNQAVLSHSQGDKNQAPIDAKGHPMGVAICYEVAYPETTRNNARGSEFLLTVSNDAWFGTSAGPHQHLQMVQMRSMETGRWFVRGTNTGISAIIDHQGKVVSRAPQFERLVLRGEVQMRTGQTPYMRFGLYPVLMLAALLLLMSFIAKQQAKRMATDLNFRRYD